MGFYNEISKYYDLIFPAGEEQIKFIEEVAGETGASILDIACGSGTYSVELAKKGYRVTAVDLEAEMVRRVKEKSDIEKVHIETAVCSMTELEQKITKMYDVLFCIGNSIVHLSSVEEIDRALGQMYKLVKPGGALIVQIMNYDRILRLGLKELPPIINQEVGVEFIRQYDYNPGKNSIAFNTTLIVKGDTPKTYKNTVELLPLMSHQLIKLLDKAGFKKCELYGDFNYSPYNEDSYMLVIKALK